MGWSFSGVNPAGTLTTSLPSSPVDGQLIVLTDSLTAPTYQWQLQYVSAKASNKWIYIGGAPGYSEVTTEPAETTSSTTYAALTTAGPSFAVPVAGDYIVGTGFSASSTPGSLATMYMSYDIGGTSASDVDAVWNMPNTTAAIDSVYRVRKKTGLTAVTLTAKYRASTSTSVSFQGRTLTVTPIAIGG